MYRPLLLLLLITITSTTTTTIQCTHIHPVQAIEAAAAAGLQLLDGANESAAVSVGSFLLVLLCLNACLPACLPCHPIKETLLL